MKTTILRSLSLLGISLALALSTAAQDAPKIKTSDNEQKYKSEDLKVKDKKDEEKYKSDDLKMKDKKDETKYKAEGLKAKDKKDEVKYKEGDLKAKAKKDETKYKVGDAKLKDEKGDRKIKGKVAPMELTKTERTEMKTGETQVRTKEHLEPITERTTTIPQPVVAPPPAIPKVSTTSPAPRKYAAAKKAAPRKPATTRTNRPKYIVRTKVVRDTVTVVVPSPPEKIVTTQTEYVHDTVNVTRVDTVVKTETQNTYDGYPVPKGDFKKVKLKRDKDNGDVWMKRKDSDGKTKTEKLEK